MYRHQLLQQESFNGSSDKENADPADEQKNEYGHDQHNPVHASAVDNRFCRFHILLEAAALTLFRPNLMTLRVVSALQGISVATTLFERVRPRCLGNKEALLDLTTSRSNGVLWPKPRSRDLSKFWHLCGL